MISIIKICICIAKKDKAIMLVLHLEIKLNISSILSE
jgi:hypothetical protein